MSSPGDRGGRPGEDPGDGSGWREPAHLGDGDDSRPGGEAGPPSDTPPAASDRGRDDANAAQQWEPPGWSLPPATRPEGPPPVPAGPPPEPVAGVGTPPPAPVPTPPPVAWGGSRRGEVAKVFSYQGDLVGAQGWAMQHGWTVSDGSAPEDAVLAELIASAPVRATREHRAASVLRGRAGNLELVAFDVVYVDRRRVVPEYAVTAAPLLTPMPPLRLSPARFWKHRVGGLLHIPSGDPHFDSRWVLLAAEDGPQVRRVVADPAVQGLLLGTDDGDEFWTAYGHLAAIRPDGHRPQLLEHHARLLTALVTALTGGL